MARTPTRQYANVNAATEGDVCLYFYSGDTSRAPSAVKVLPRGPHGQLMIQFLDGPCAGTTFAVGYNELFVEIFD